MSQLVVKITDGNDDGHVIEGVDDFQVGGATVISFQRDDGGYDLWPGWRFLGITIPQAATIDAATLTVECNTATSGGVSGGLFGNAIDNTLTMVNHNDQPNHWTLTAASATLDGTTTGTKNITVTTIIQEIINRAGWVSGNALGLAALTFTTPSGSRLSKFDDFDNVGDTTQAQLTIDYTVGGGTVIPILTRQYRARVGS